MRVLPHQSCRKHEDRRHPDSRDAELPAVPHQYRRGARSLFEVPLVPQQRCGAGPAPAHGKGSIRNAEGETVTGTMRGWGATDRGCSRTNNEDSWALHDSLNVAILADGMGGESCGEVGSAVTVCAVKDYLCKADPGLGLEELAQEAIRAANREVIQEAQNRRECDGMGSTVVVALWRLPEIVIANVGD